MITADHFQVSDLFKGGEILAEAIFQGVAVKLALRKLLQHGVHHPGLTNADSRVNIVFRVIHQLRHTRPGAVALIIGIPVFKELTLKHSVVCPRLITGNSAVDIKLNTGNRIRQRCGGDFSTDFAVNQQFTPDIITVCQRFTHNQSTVLSAEGFTEARLRLVLQLFCLLFVQSCL